MQRALATLVLAVVAVGVGCTRVEVHKSPGVYDKGVRYYRPKPYLFISPGKVGGSPPLFTIEQGAPLQTKEVAAAAATGAEATVSTASFNQAAEALPEAQAATTPDATQDGALTEPQRAEVDDIVKKSVDSLACPTTCIPGGAVCTQRPTAISMSLQYLPDFSEEYSIQLKPGLGIGTLSVKLDNGWNLTSVNMETDQQTDEIIKSTADLIGSIGGLAGGGNKGVTPDAVNSLEAQCMPGTIYATNVPFGYYEAVIATDPCGRKQLYGWRYVGFMPFQACPVQSGGMDRMCCNDLDVYGLVWVNGILQFERIGVIPTEPQRESVAPKETTTKK